MGAWAERPGSPKTASLGQSKPDARSKDRVNWRPLIAGLRIPLVIAGLAVSMALDGSARALARETDLSSLHPMVSGMIRGITFLGDFPLLISVSILLAAWGYWVRHREGDRWFDFGWGLSFSLVVASVIVKVSKHLIGRERPFLLRSPYVGPAMAGPTLMDGYDSFPSGHAASAFVVAALLAARWPSRKGFFYLIAVLVALSRLLLDVHYLSDILAGGMIGYYTARAYLAAARPSGEPKPS